MSDQTAADTTPTGVSPLRRKISAALLLTVIVVLVIEVRAGAGHSLSGAALEAASEDGVFKNTLLSDVEAMIKVLPSKTVVRENTAEIEYRYSWFSLLRPLLGRPKAELFVVSTREAEPAYALIYNTDAPTPKQIEDGLRGLKNLNEQDASEDGSEDGASGHDMEEGSDESGSDSSNRPQMDDGDESESAVEISADPSTTEAAAEAAADSTAGEATDE